MSAAEQPQPTGFFGHPKGLAYLAFTEAWERFSYYGMISLLVLYMVNQLLLPGHVEQVAGFAGFRGGIERVFGPLTTQQLASQIFGLYAGFVYFTPVLGGWLADRWIGQRTAVVLGALSMAGGHVAMAFDQSFLLALLLLVVGSGLLKGNISAQVGGLYPGDEEARRTRGFVIFSTAINLGAVTGPLVCGFLGTRYGWHLGFGLAALFMLAGLATYLAGYRYLPSRVERKVLERTAAMSRSDWKIVAALGAVMVIAIFQSIAYYQLANVLPIWLQQHADLNAGGFAIPVPWFSSIDPLASMVSVPFLFALWRRQADRSGSEPSDLGKIGMGAWVCALANLVLVGAIASSSAKVLWVWPLLYCVLQGVGFIYYWPTLLALVSRCAPSRINATMMGICFLVLFIANNLIGWIGTYYAQMTPIGFWLMHAGIAAAGGISILLLGPMLRHILEPRETHGLRPAALTEEVER